METIWLSSTACHPKLCKILKIADCTIQIENRIEREIKQDDTAADHVYMNGEKEISLDDTGLFLFADVFTGYTEQGAIIDAWKWLKDMNKARRSQYDFDRLIVGMSRTQLRCLMRESRRWARGVAVGMVRRATRKAYRHKICKAIIP